ncbi:hypothetical protein J5Y03_12370 [Bacillus sp. RG28]|uniref:Lipoprotein n=1 Tax=Gottfriedia endophytica TaxID=2820819 RepID=A0A940NKN9_9BACI|nr:hypothetical protein [Gottfriedia endophytica]MBP0725967.1 hypothetical protein [Gottfriedia endophytica]
MKKCLILSIALLICGLVMGCSKYGGQSNYSSLSQNEIKQFVSQKKIEPLSIEDVQNSTLILYENGIYGLSKENGKIIENQTGWVGNSKEKVIIGMTSTGSPHVSVIIEDKNLLKEANEVKVVFSDGKSVTKPFEGKRGLLVFYDKNKSNLTINDGIEISIFNKKGIVIYKHTL